MKSLGEDAGFKYGFSVENCPTKKISNQIREKKIHETPSVVESTFNITVTGNTNRILWKHIFFETCLKVVSSQVALLQSYHVGVRSHTNIMFGRDMRNAGQVRTFCSISPEIAHTDSTS